MTLALLAFGLPGGTAPAAAQTDKPALQADEQNVQTLVEQMGDAKYRVRQAAYEQLKAMGPEILPLLARYRNHKDPEIRARVQEIMDAYAWLTRGVMVVKIEPGTQAVASGMRVGDVVVKMNDLDITNQDDVRILRSAEDRTLYIWREGKVISIRAAAGKIGFYSTNWEVAKGGENQARGYAAMAAGRFEEAYARLNAALGEGMDDLWCITTLAGLAEYNFDHARAMEIHDNHLKASWGFIRIGDMKLLETYYRLPLSSIHTAVLLRRTKSEQPGAELWEQLQNHFLDQGRNIPLIREISRETTSRTDRALSTGFEPNDKAGLFLACQDHRWNDALRDFEAMPSKDMQSASLGVQAAVNAGRADVACQIASAMVAAFLERRTSAGQASDSLYAVAAACAAGKEHLAKELLEEIASGGLDRFLELLRAAPCCTWRHSAAAPAVLDAMMDKAGQLSLLDDAGRQAFCMEMLELLSLSPRCTLEAWTTAMAAFGREKGPATDPEMLNARCLLRFGRYAEAKKALEKAADTSAEKAPVSRALTFLWRHADRLERDWSDLKGVIYLYDGRDQESHWAVRHDGRILHIDPAGKIHRYPGISEGEAHLAWANDRIEVALNAILCLREGQIYLLDEKAGQWLPTFAASGTSQAEFGPEALPALAAALRYVLRHYPISGPGRELWSVTKAPAGWVCFQFGDAALAVDLNGQTVINLSQEILRLAGRKNPVPIYRVTGEEANPDKLFIPTGAGLWSMDAKGRIEQVKLAQDQANAMVCLLSRPERKGKLYVGIAPQQGGQVFELDVKTGAVVLTKGYCGYGPDEYPLAARNCGYGIQALYAKRLAGGNSPSTAPAGATQRGP